MRRRFSARNNILVGRNVLSAGGILLSIAAVAVLLRMFAPNTLISVAAPLWKVGSVFSDSFAIVPASFREKATLIDERDALIRQNESLLIENAALAEKASDLSALFGPAKAKRDGILAAVLAHPPVSPYDTLITDAGSGEGVTVGALVRGPGGIPLGTVESVTADGCRVVLFSAPERETNAWLGTSRIPVTLVGRGAGAFTLSVPRDAKVEIGDVIVVSGSFPIAVVMSVARDPSSAIATVRVKPSANPFSITWVDIAFATTLP